LNRYVDSLSWRNFDLLPLQVEVNVEVQGSDWNEVVCPNNEINSARFVDEIEEHKAWAFPLGVFNKLITFHISDDIFLIILRIIPCKVNTWHILEATICSLETISNSILFLIVYGNLLLFLLELFVFCFVVWMNLSHLSCKLGV
jgi:hypothetical protein